MFERIERLLEIETINKIKETKILLIGLGGVGGYTFESLLRTGFKEIAVIDKDVFDITNLKISVSSFDESETSIDEMVERIHQDIKNNEDNSNDDNNNETDKIF